MTTRILIGCGYLGYRVAKRWQQAGDHTIATTRRDDPTQEMIDAHTFTGQLDVTKPETLGWLSEGIRLGGQLPSALLYAVGHDRTAGLDIHTVYAQGLSNVLASLPGSVTRAIYISTTGVYGPAGGEWIDEDTSTDPQRDGGKASLAAEQVLARHPIGKCSIILRLAGIYGPGRIPFIDDLRAGRPIAAPQSGYLNLVHIDDAAAVVVAASQMPQFDDGPRVYCVSDGHPVERRDFYNEVARNIGAPPPQFVEPDPNSARALRAAGNRRVRNERLLRELQVKLTYPDYRAGLAGILDTVNQ